MKRYLFYSIKVLAAIIFLALCNQPAVAQGPDKLVNLKILPKDITNRELFDKMQDMARSLGTRCNFCHVGEGDDLSKFDFASDDKDQKRIARIMMTMVENVNNQHIARAIAEKKEAPVEKVMITCYTCHVGKTKPILKRPEN